MPSTIIKQKTEKRKQPDRACKKKKMIEIKKTRQTNNKIIKKKAKTVIDAVSKEINEKNLVEFQNQHQVCVHRFD